MDRLEKSKQSELRKMSDIRLVSKLTQAGYTVDVVESMDRLAMLDKWAEVVLAGKDIVVNQSVTAAVATGYDTEVERQKLLFQVKQWEEEMIERKAERAEREAQRELENKRVEAEKAEREA